MGNVNMDRKRILIIGHTYAAPVNRLKFDLMARGERFEFLLLAPKKWRNYLTTADNSTDNEAKNYRIEFIDVLFGGRMVLYLIPKLRRIIKEFKPHLIYCEQEPICLVSLQTAILAKKTPVIFFSWENINRKDMKYRMFSVVRALCHRKAIFMVAGSKEAASVIRRREFRKPIYITPILGVNEQLFSPQEKNVLRGTIPQCSFLIGYVGRFVEAKDVKTLFKAVKLLDGTVDWHLVLLGNGPQRHEYEELIHEFGMTEKVTFHRAVSHNEVPQILNAFDVLVLPSKTTPKWKEQFGHVLIEAMACGVPVIGSSSGEIPNVIGNAGLVFKEGDAEDLRAKLIMLSENPHLREVLRQSGIQRVKERFTDARIAANMIAMYEIALNMDRKTPNTLGVDIVTQKIKLKNMHHINTTSKFFHGRR
jgi:glycosyltransferase involved in cell wall biosynthesis